MMWIETIPSHWWSDLGAVELFILGMATWRLTSLLVNEEGPWNIFARLRYMIGIRYNERSERVSMNVLAEGLSCVWCSSIWVASLVLLSYALVPRTTLIVSLILTLSSIAILIEKAVNCD